MYLLFRLTADNPDKQWDRGIAAVRSLTTQLVVLPQCDGGCDVPLLALLRSAPEQDYHAVAILAKVNPVTWAEVDGVFVNSKSTPLTLEKFPCPSRVTATVTLAAAVHSVRRTTRHSKEYLDDDSHNVA